MIRGARPAWRPPTLALGALLLALECYAYATPTPSGLLAVTMLVAVDGAVVCLGTRVAPHLVVTARHCVQQAHEAPAIPARVEVASFDRSLRAEVRAVRLRGGRRYAHLGELAGRDIAVLVVDAGRIDGLKARYAEVAPADEGAPFFVGVGRDASRAPRFVRTTATSFGHELVAGPITCGGDSGGGLFDPAGRLVGVASWRTLGACGSGRSVFTGLREHLTWLRSLGG